MNSSLLLNIFNDAHILFWLLKAIYIVACQPFLHINSTKGKIYLVGSLIITTLIKIHILFDPAIPLTKLHHTDIFAWKHKDISTNIHCSVAIKDLNILQ